MNANGSRTEKIAHLLKKGSREVKGRDVQRMNLLAAVAMADAIKTSLGPNGLDKLIVDVAGDLTITRDGRIILDEMEFEHPIAKLLFEAARALDREVGDGTTSLVILAGELLREASHLMEIGVHPALIIEGYNKAVEKSVEMANETAIRVDPTDGDLLRKVAKTALAGRMIAEFMDTAPDLAVDAMLQVAEKQGDQYRASLDDVKIEWKYGEWMGSAELIKGMLLDRGVVHSEMPKKVEGARLALLAYDLRVEKPVFDAKVEIGKPESMQRLIDEEVNSLREMANSIRKAGANVVVSLKEIDETVGHFLAQEGILAVKNIKKWDFERLAKATGARIVTNTTFLAPEHLGYAELVEEEEIEKGKWVFVRGCRNPKAVAILVKASYRKLAEEGKEAMQDALFSVKDILEKPFIVAGGGAFEIEVSARLRKWGGSLPGKEQLAVLAFANALEGIPSALAENGGMDPINTLVELRARHNRAEIYAGIDAAEKRIADTMGCGIVEPLSVKEQVLKGAGELAILILRVDDVLLAPKFKPKLPQQPPGVSFGDYTKSVE